MKPQPNPASFDQPLANSLLKTLREKELDSFLSDYIILNLSKETILQRFHDLSNQILEEIDNTNLVSLHDLRLFRLLAPYCEPKEVKDFFSCLLANIKKLENELYFTGFFYHSTPQMSQEQLDQKRLQAYLCLSEIGSLCDPGLASEFLDLIQEI